VLRHAHLGHGAPTYSLAIDPPPVHLVCARCGDVQSAPVTDIAAVLEVLESKHGFVADASHISLTGVCRACTPAAPTRA
jgi:Fur family transcriptional regulator, ferric uptake regulator